NTSLHGVPRITLSRGYFRKVTWILLVLGGAAFAMYHLGKIVQNYREYPLSTLLSIENNNKLDFPAVTICNMNPARRSILKQKAEELGYTELLDVINEAVKSSGEEEEETEESDEEFFEALTSLTMELYLDENEYSEFLADTVGAKLHVHQQGIMAFPEDDGISLTPGLSTSVGISQIQVKRSIPPHGRCRHYSSDDNYKVNMYAGAHKLQIDYSEKACQKTCYQKNLIRDCECCHFDYPCSGYALRKVIEGVKVPKLKRWRCMGDIFQKYERDELDCSNDCAQSCSETVYSTDISTGRWPSVPLIRRTMGKVRSLYKRKNESIPTSEEDMDVGDQLKRNVIKVEIFYKQLNYEYLKATPAYDWSSLISDIGGQAGLWVGFSVLTLIELAE
ncbi:hypothetical protein LOTGIDRAFT_72911, partial [Lottia gigantea]